MRNTQYSNGNSHEKSFFLSVLLNVIVIFLIIVVSFFPFIRNKGKVSQLFKLIYFMPVKGKLKEDGVMWFEAGESIFKIRVDLK